MLRLVAQGVDPAALRPLIVDELDVSTPAGRSVLMLGVLTYFLLFATLTGGLHLAIDTTAGERERKSLEPLLTTPVSRTSLIVGKMAATVLLHARCRSRSRSPHSRSRSRTCRSISSA